jgi:hypothetical protein
MQNKQVKKSITALSLILGVCFRFSRCRIRFESEGYLGFFRNLILTWKGVSRDMTSLKFVRIFFGIFI